MGLGLITVEGGARGIVENVVVWESLKAQLGGMEVAKVVIFDQEGDIENAMRVKRGLEQELEGRVEIERIL